MKLDHGPELSYSSPDQGRDFRLRARNKKSRDTRNAIERGNYLWYRGRGPET
jgi:hypothetical protein